MDQKPQIRALVAWPLPSGRCILTREDTVTLEDAASYKALGFMVLVDPADEAALARWEQLNGRPRWNRW